MSDYLGRLAARALGTAPVIRPLIPTLYEPLSPASGELGESHAWRDEDQDHEARPGRPRRRVSASPSGQPEPKTPDRADIAEADGMASRQARVRRGATPFEPETAAPPSPGRELLRPATPTAAGTSDAVASASTPSDAPESLAEPVARTILPEPLQRTLPLGAEHPIPESRALEYEPSLDASTELEPVSTAVPPEVPIRLATPSIRVRQSEAAFSPRSPASYPAVPGQSDDDSADRPPDVHVTIGRVEVRAVTPPAKVPGSPKPPVPRLSLDDYLAQRIAGKR